MKKILYSLAVVAVVCSFIGCVKSEKKEKGFSVQGLVLVPAELGGEAISACKLNPKPVLLFDSVESRFNGNTGCNNMFGGYTVENDKFTFDGVGMTRMMCDPEANAIENKMLEVVNNANRYTNTDSTVTFYKNEEVLGVFKIKSRECCSAKQGGEAKEHACSHNHEGEHACKKEEAKPACNKDAAEHSCKKDGAQAEASAAAPAVEKVEIGETKAQDGKIVVEGKAQKVEETPAEVNKVATKEMPAKTNTVPTQKVVK